jgi:hypothetical protein
MIALTMTLISSSYAEGFGLTGENRDSKDMQSLLSKRLKIDNNTDPYHHLWRFDA